MISVTVAAVDSAPLVNFASLFCSAWIAALPALSICWRLRCSGPSISHLRVESMLRVTWLTRSGKPTTNWLMTKVRMPPRIAKPASNHQGDRATAGAPRRSSQSTDRNQQCAQHQRQQQWDDDDFQSLDHP